MELTKEDATLLLQLIMSANFSGRDVEQWAILKNKIVKFLKEDSGS